jgi:hypothetical protein
MASLGPPDLKSYEEHATVSEFLTNGDEKAYFEAVNYLSFRSENEKKKKKEIKIFHSDGTESVNSYCKNFLTKRIDQFFIDNAVTNITCFLKKTDKYDLFDLINDTDKTKPTSVGHFSFWKRQQESNPEQLSDEKYALNNYSHFKKPIGLKSDGSVENKEYKFLWEAVMEFSRSQYQTPDSFIRIYLQISIDEKDDPILNNIIRIINDALKNAPDTNKSNLFKRTYDQLEGKKRTAFLTEKALSDQNSYIPLGRTVSLTSQNSDENEQSFGLKPVDLKPKNNKKKNKKKGKKEGDDFLEQEYRKVLELREENTKKELQEQKRIEEEQKQIFEHPYRYFRDDEIYMKMVFKNWNILYEIIKTRVDLGEYLDSLKEYIQTFKSFNHVLENKPRDAKGINSLLNIVIVDMYKDVNESEPKYQGYCLKQYILLYFYLFYNPLVGELLTSDEMETRAKRFGQLIFSPIVELYSNFSSMLKLPEYFINYYFIGCVNLYCKRDEISTFKNSDFCGDNTKFTVEYIEKIMLKLELIILMNFYISRMMGSYSELDSFSNTFYKTCNILIKINSQRSESESDRRHQLNMVEIYDKSMKKALLDVFEKIDSLKRKGGKRTMKHRKRFKCKKTLKGKKHIKRTRRR